MNTILKTVCQDEIGLIAKITTTLNDFNANIIKNSEFVDSTTETFFMRTEFNADINEKDLLAKLNQVLPNNSQISLHKQQKQKIVVLATKEMHCLGDLLMKNYANELNCEIVAVISNHQILQDLVQRFDIPFVFVPTKDLSHLEHDRLVSEQIDKFDFDYLVLAKYMRILTPEFVEKYENKIINIHHSFLPAFIGAKPYHQAFERGVKIIGATCHFVNNNLDEGPIITQDVQQVNHTFTAENLAKLGKDIEKRVLTSALDLVFSHKVFIHNNKTIIL